MKVYVCVKSVPDSAAAVFDPERGTLRRAGQTLVLNPCDMVAMEAGVRYAKKTNGVLSAVSMGPHSAEAGLRMALAMGADKAYLLNSNWFAGADVPATAYVLSAFFKKHNDFDVIFCGKHSADGDTGQTGAMLAELLQIPHACAVSEILKLENGMLEAVQHMDDCEIRVRMKLPCLVVIRNDFCIPAMPTLQGVLRARKQKIDVEDERSMEGLEKQRCGLIGSGTKVIKLFVPPKARENKKLAADDLQSLLPVLKESQ